MDSTVPSSHMFRITLLMWVIAAAKASVSYDDRALIINGHRRILISGSIHYPRSTPDMWPDLIQKAKDGGVEVIETYVFWNGHEPSPGNYNFEGSYDLVEFIKAVHKAGLYAMLRIGPYVCAEWNFGGFPVWLKYVPGIAFRTDNQPFKVAMRKFTEKIVNMMNGEKLFEPQGGPIIISQIENEYGLVESGLGTAGKMYMSWASRMAVGLKTEVPWVMCKQADAPDPVINTWNDYYSDAFVPNSRKKPKIWTENWTGWFTAFGDAVPHRPVEDIAYAVARFIEKGGSFVNYYMYHGGTNFGRTAGGPFIATSYDYDAPIDEYGLLREPKWGHLRHLHEAIKQSEPALVAAYPKYTKLGDKQEAHIFRSKTACAAFLANNDPNYPVNVTFQNLPYLLPPWSVSILPTCRTVAFNTAKVTAPSSRVNFNPVKAEPISWQSHNEIAASALDHDAVTMKGLQDQISLTRDASDYLWYMTTVEMKDEDLKNGKSMVLSVMSACHVLHVFVNGHYSGTAHGHINKWRNLKMNANVTLNNGVNTISLLSVAMGLPNIGFLFETWKVGVLGPVTLGGQDLTKNVWSYKIGMQGEASNLFSGKGSYKWAKGPSLAKNQPLIWYKAAFSAPEGNDPVALDMGSMKKGQIWVNSNHIGRYWPAYLARGICQKCSYAGTFNENKCVTNCHEASQKWYHIPRSWLKPTENLVVVLEEMGGNPTEIALVTRTV